jgi:hypothetical protein
MMVKQVWSEAEPYGLTLKHHPSMTWIPTPQGPTDIPIIKIAKRHHSMRDTRRINRYRLYLRVISLYDLLTYTGHQIHPEIEKGKRISSRVSTIHLVEFPKPPGKDNVLWTSFIDTHIKPILQRTKIVWDSASTPILTKPRSSIPPSITTYIN